MSLLKQLNEQFEKEFINEKDKKEQAMANNEVTSDDEGASGQETILTSEQKTLLLRLNNYLRAEKAENKKWVVSIDNSYGKVIGAFDSIQDCKRFLASISTTLVTRKDLYDLFKINDVIQFNQNTSRGKAFPIKDYAIGPKEQAESR